MSNQKPWTLLQVGDKVVFKNPNHGEYSFTITGVTDDKYNGTWSDPWPSNQFHPSLTRTDPAWPMFQPPWWSSMVRVDPAPLSPWYTKLAVGDTFRNALGTVFTVVAVREKEIEALWNNPLNGGRTQRVTISLREDSWITKSTLATPLSIAAMQPPVEPPWYSQLRKGDTFTKEEEVWTVTAGPSKVDGTLWVNTPKHCGNRPIAAINRSKWFADASPLSVAALKPTAPWWHTAQVGDRFSHPLYGNLTVTRVQGDNPPSGIDARREGETSKHGVLFFSVPSGTSDCALNESTLLSRASQQPSPTLYSPSPGDRCYVDQAVWEVTEANPRLGMDDYWQIRMKSIGSAIDRTWCPVQSTSWCQENLIPTSHWSRNLKVGDRIEGDDGVGPITWAVVGVLECGQYTLRNAIDQPRTLCPIIDRRWFSKAKLLPQAEPAPLPNNPPHPLEVEPPPAYPCYHVPTIPLDDLAVGEAVDVPAGRYSKAMISDIVATYGKRAAEAGEKERIFGVISTETTHTIWREM